MNHKQFLFAEILVLLALFTTLVAGGANNTTSRIRVYRDAQAPVEDTSQNEIDDRIQVGEPIKSLLQTTVRFALAQTKLTKHMNIDMAMEVINGASFLLAKQKILIRVVEFAAFVVVSLIIVSILFPSSLRLIEAVWRDPVNTLNLDRYLSNGVHESSVLGLVGAKTDDLLKRVGLDHSTCRYRSICYIGEILKCTVPQTAESLTKFFSDNFSSSSLKEHGWVKAFSSGFVDQNCTNIATEETGCFANFVNSIFGQMPQKGSLKARRGSY